MTDLFRLMLQHANEIMLVVLFIIYPLSLLLMIVLPLIPNIDRHPFWMLALSNAVFCYWLVSDTASPDDRLGFGTLIAFAVIVLFLICFAIGAAIATFTQRQKALTRPYADILFAITASIPIPFIILFPLGVFSRWPGIIAFSLLICIAVALICLAFFAGPAHRLRVPFDRFGVSCLMIATTLTVAAATAYISAIAVWTEAERLADGHRYCLQSGNRPIDNMIDASILTLREPKHSRSGPRYLRNHGLLIVDSEEGRHVFNWSYRMAVFVSESLYDSPNQSARPMIWCKPK